LLPARCREFRIRLKAGERGRTPGEKGADEGCLFLGSRSGWEG
jgi:hypothetical protein